MSMAAKAFLVFQSEGGRLAPNFMKSQPIFAAMLLKNSEPTAFFLGFLRSEPSAAFAAASACFCAFSSL